MVKLTLVSAALLVVVVLAMSEASSAFRSTIIIEEESNPRGMEGMCKDQMVRQQMLSQCRMYLRGMMHEGLMNSGRGEEEYMDMCCQQLRSMNEECRCDGLKKAVRMQMKKDQGERSEMVEEKMMREAEKMYSKCDLTPRTCHMHRSA